MRVVAGRPDPIAQTPMMNAFIRYIALNPYWNSPADITAKKLAPTILKEGRAYFKNRGYYQLLSKPEIDNPDQRMADDIYSFTQGYSKAARVSRTIGHGAADVLTLGLWEVVGTPTEAAFNGTPVVYEVTYDSSDRIENVVVLKK